MKAASTSFAITVHVPLTFTTRGNTKRIVSDAGAQPPMRVESALIKAVARAYRWRRMIESDEFSSITELAKAHKVNQSYACRLLRLTLLSPNIVVAILDGRLQPAPTLSQLMKPLSSLWDSQERAFAVEQFCDLSRRVWDIDLAS